MILQVAPPIFHLGGCCCFLLGGALTYSCFEVWDVKQVSSGLGKVTMYSIYVQLYLICLYIVHIVLFIYIHICYLSWIHLCMESLIYVNEMFMGGPNIKLSLPFVHSKSVSYDILYLVSIYLLCIHVFKNCVCIFVGFIFEDRCRWQDHLLMLYCNQFLPRIIMVTPLKINMEHNSLEVWFRSVSFPNGWWL